MIEKQILELHKKGISRANIAQRLKVSEWKVRTTIRGQITKNVHKQEYVQDTEIRLRKVNKVDSISNYLKVIVLSDIHIPYHDQRALAIAIEYMKDYEPDTIILNGDIVDFYGASSYRQDPTRIDTLQDELNETKAFIKLVRTNHPNAKIVYLSGNHENRLERFLLDKAPALTSLTCLAYDELIGLKEYNIDFIDYGSSIQLGDLEITHGDVVRKGSGASAKAHMSKSGGSVLHGHTHRLGTVFMTNKWGTHVGIENGFLGRRDFEYVGQYADWQHGFTEILYNRYGPFHIRQHRIDDTGLVVDGILYSAE